MTHGLLGGICLDDYDKVPSPYDKYLKISKNVMIKTGTILCGEGFHFERREGKQDLKQENGPKFYKCMYPIPFHLPVMLAMMDL